MTRCNTTCCTAEAIPGRSRCEPCLAKVKAAQKARRSARLAAGRCGQCDEPQTPGLTLCERHRAMRQAADWRAKSGKLAARIEREERRKGGGRVEEGEG